MKWKAKVKMWWHECWRRYHNVKYMKHRHRHSVHLAKRGRSAIDSQGRTVQVRQEA